MSQAIKVYNKKLLSRKRTGVSDSLQSAYLETSILKSLRHPNVVSALEVIDDPHSNNMYLGILWLFNFSNVGVLEYVAGGPIMVCDALFSIPEEDARLYFVGLMKGVEYCMLEAWRGYNFIFSALLQYYSPRFETW